METRKIRIELSKRGIPCLWEDGGGYSNTGDSTIIADMHGNPKKPIYISRAGHLSCGQHALIPVRINDLVIEASHHRRDFSIAISKIVAIDKEEKFAQLEKVNVFSMGEWDKELDEKLEKPENHKVFQVYSLDEEGETYDHIASFDTMEEAVKFTKINDMEVVK